MWCVRGRRTVAFFTLFCCLFAVALATVAVSGVRTNSPSAVCSQTGSFSSVVAFALPAPAVKAGAEELPGERPLGDALPGGGLLAGAPFGGYAGSLRRYLLLLTVFHLFLRVVAWNQDKDGKKRPRGRMGFAKLLF